MLKDRGLHNSNCLFRFFYSVGFAMVAHCSIEVHKIIFVQIHGKSGWSGGY